MIDPEAYRNRNVLVTGGAGFIGSHLVRRLVIYGADVIVIDDFSSGLRTNISEVEEDIQLIESDLAKMSRPLQGFPDVEHVFHFAAIPSVSRSESDPALIHRANVTSTLRLLEIARRIDPESVVFAGSTVRGAAVSGYDRSHADSPCTVYAATKGAMELYAETYVERHDLPVLLFRLSHVFGPGQQERGYAGDLSSLIQQVLDDSAPELSRTKRQGHDYIFVEDVVDAFLLGGHSPEYAGSAFDICSGRRLSDRELLERIDDILEREVREPKFVSHELTYEERKKCDPKPAREKLGFEPQISFEEGLARTLDWFQNRP